MRSVVFVASTRLTLATLTGYPRQCSRPAALKVVSNAETFWVRLEAYMTSSPRETVFKMALVGPASAE